MMSSNSRIHFSSPPREIRVGALALSASEALAEEQMQREREGRDEAHRRGFEEAMTYLDGKMLEQRSDFGQLQDNTFRSLAKANETLSRQFSEMVPVIALEVARRIIGDIPADPDRIARLCSETLAEISPGTGDVQVWLAPGDHKLVQGIEAEFSHKYPGIQLHPDPDLTPGDCRVQSRFGVIDGRVATKLANLGRALA